MLGVINLNEYNYDYLGINGMIPNGAANFMNNVPNNMMNGSNMGFNPDNSMGICFLIYMINIRIINL